VQEFRDKTSKIDGLTYHFFGRLQKNKVKYLVGNVALIHSIDSIDLAKEVSSCSVKKGVTTNVLIEVNCGEESKGGFAFSEVEDAVKAISKLDGVLVKGIMAMLPHTEDEDVLIKNCLLLRSKYDKLKKDGYPFEYLSVGMSGDYKIAISNGSNMIRVGTGIFGERDYTKKVY
jgi:pyridoxal phosphate enzyme (YggS family)